MNETEKAFEEFIESYLISEEGGWTKASDVGLRSEESRGMNLDIVTLTDFVKSTQPMACPCRENRNPDLLYDTKHSLKSL